MAVTQLSLGIEEPLSACLCPVIIMVVEQSETAAFGLPGNSHSATAFMNYVCLLQLYISVLGTVPFGWHRAQPDLPGFLPSYLHAASNQILVVGLAWERD